MTVVCGDSHLHARRLRRAGARHRHQRGRACAGHADAAGQKAKNMLVGRGPTGARLTAKDIVLAIIGRIGTAGGTSYTIEFGGSAIRALSMEGRMTVCNNMAIEAGARRPGGGGRQDHDRLRPGRPFAAGVGMGPGRRLLAHACAPTTARASTPWSSSTRRRSAAGHLGHLAGDGGGRSTDRVPDPDTRKDAVKRGAIERALAYMGWSPNKAISDIPSTRCSSARAPTAASRTCAKPRPVRAQAPGRRARRRTSSWRWWCRARPGQGQAEAEGAARGLQGGRLRVARARLQDVPGDERRPAGAGRALRLHQQPQLRRPPGAPAAARPGQPGDGRSGCDRRPFRRRRRIA